jgi:hypothetical protein
VEALLDYEDRVFSTISRESERGTSGTLVPLEACLRSNDTAVRTSDTHLIELSFDIQKVVDALKVATLPQLQRGLYFYVTQEEIPGSSRLHRVSDWVACVLRSCEHPRCVSEIFEQLTMEITEVEEKFRPYTFVKLLKGAQSKGFIRILRTANLVSEHVASGA